MAEVLHGGLRPTYDVDINYRRTPENLARLAAALTEIKPSLRGADANLPFIADVRTLQAGSNFTLMTSIGPLDLLGWVEPIGEYDSLLPQADSMSFAGRIVRVLSIDALIRVKRHINRPRDIASLNELEAIRRNKSGDASSAT